jgi:hypothetical protein
MTVVPFGDWRPDDPAYGTEAATIARNVYPRTDRSYGPMTQWAEYSSALAARCQGGAAVIDSAGNVRVFAGDASALYVNQGGTGNFADVTRASGPYNVGADATWRILQFGNDIIATQVADAPQVYTLGVSAQFDVLSTAAPRARHAAIIKNFLMLGGIVDAIDGERPQRLHWSGLNDPRSWPTPGTSAANAVQSDRQDIQGNGGWVQGIYGGVGAADCIIPLEREIHRATYVGAPLIFQFDQIERARGMPAPGVAAHVGNMIFYLGQDGFYSCDGISSTPIGAARVDKWFWRNVDQTYLPRTSCAVDAINKLVHWAVPLLGDGGKPSTLLTFNWQLGRWAYSTIETEYLMPSLTFGYTLEGLDQLSASLDALPFSLDSRAYTGNSLILGGWTANHRLAYPTGATLEAVMETGEVSGLQPHTRAYVNGARPHVDGGAPTVAVGSRETPGGTVSWSTATTVGRNGIAPTRVSARYVRYRVTVPAGSSWQHAIGIEPVSRDAGRA